MSLPVSQYEALLAEVRDLRHKAAKVQQLATPLLGNASSTSRTNSNIVSKDGVQTSLFSYPLSHTMESIIEKQHSTIKYDRITGSSIDGEVSNGDDECGRASSAHLSVSSEPISHENRSMAGLYHGTWPVEKTMWNSEPTSLGPSALHCNSTEMTSVMSFASSSGGAPLDRVLSSPDRSRRSSQQLEAKVDMVYSLLSMLGGQEHADMGETLLALSTSPESCLAMRQSGCIPLLVQLVQSDKDADTRKKAAEALNNLISSNTDEKLRKRETRVLKLLEQIRLYTSHLHNHNEITFETLEDGDKHPVQTVAHLMKLSFDEGHRQAICQLGGIHAIANLVESEHALHGSTTEESHCILLRRYSCMALTNLTFGDSGNKALLCSFRDFMRALVVQLQSPCDELRQVTASVLRNLSWRADTSSKEILREVGAVTGLMNAAMINNKENTLKSILSALWNLSAHCTESKSEICAVEGALGFLVNMLTYKSPTKSLAIIENAGGILRNISSQIAIREDYRELLRNHNCLKVLLDQLKSPSLTIVSNACGTLWNLSAKSETDQELLWKMGAPAMLRSLNHSKHKMIAMGSSAALKNLLASRPTHNLLPQLDATAKALDLPVLPTLGVRKQKALFQELEQNLSETFENTDKESPTKGCHDDKFLMESTNKILMGAQKSHKRKVLMAQKSDSVNTFTSLTENEQYTTYQRLPQSRYGSSSLPYVKPYIPIQNYSDLSYKEESTNFASQSKVIDEENFGIYTETDLDQPTDYSLRYAEDDSECDEICDKIVKSEGTDFIQDTVKTYCTEDTPYETPFNYSSSTSMTDLRKTVLDVEKQVIDNDKLTKSNVNTLKNNSMSQSDEKDHCSVEDTSEIDNAASVPLKNLKSQFSSGIASPEKPVNYADEGTPGYFSRVSSFGSLNSIPAGEKVKTELDVKENETQVESVDENLLQKAEAAVEGKVVKFEQVVNYAEETPLMFSRSSSLASLDSIEQHSIHDDRESVISDFSRLTSGIVSPSELPDSPTQTVPPSPRQRKVTTDLSSTPQTNPSNSAHRTPADGSSQKPQPKPNSIFEDNVKKFKEESTPIQFSTATSLSSLTIDDHDESNVQKLEEKQKHEKALNDDIVAAVSESEEDEDILAACISDGMQNNTHHQSSPTLYKFQPKSFVCSQNSGSRAPSTSSITVNTQIHTDSCYNYRLDDAAPMMTYSGTNSDLNTNLSVKKDDKIYSSDESSNLSGDNENILAECIQSAMPKTRRIPKPVITARPLSVRNVQTSTPIKPFSRTEQQNNLKRPGPSLYLGAKDEVENYAVENSPCQFSLHSSLSDLTIDGSIAGGSIRSNNNALSNSGQSNSNTKAVDSAGPSSLNIEQNVCPVESAVMLSRQESLSSLSADSFGSLEQEQALLEQCISSGMPKSRNKSLETKPVAKPIGVATKQFSKTKNVSEKIQCEDKLKKFGERNRDLLESEEKLSSSKNVNVTSVAGNTKMEKSVTSQHTTPTTAADVEPIKKLEGKLNYRPPTAEIQTNISPDQCTLSEKSASIKVARNGFDDDKDEFTSSGGNLDFEFDNLEITIKAVDTRMLDPDAMIESLDRFTAELVSQAEAAHSNKDNRKFTTSITEGDTWNDDSSPNDLTFPSISGSAPNVITFTSESEDLNQEVFDKAESFRDFKEVQCFDMADGGKEQEQKSSDFSSINTSTMTESTLIAAEAIKIATVFKNEADMSQSISSVQSLELDCIQPPSHMNSLTNSINGYEHLLLKGSPKLVSRKKMLHTGLLARKALSNSLNQTSSLESLSNLDHMNPPSAMADVFDLEGSIASVASLVSDAPNPIFAVKQPTHAFEFMTNNGSISDLENINPPSLFNEITDLCNSLADVATDTICSKTDVFEDCNTHVNDTEDATLYSDAQSITPIQSDLGSSTETSPKKVKTLTKRLTPKQKRKLVQERYRTYTVAAEMVISAELSSMSDNCNSEYQTVPEFSEDSRSKKMSPKEKRLNDRTRFQTQVLSEAVTAQLQTECGKADPPQKSKISIRRNFMQKRLENKDRFKTRTLSESSLSPDLSNASQSSMNGNDLEYLLEKEADRVLKKLQEAKLHTDDLLDCETLSLISNDDESELNSGSPINYRTYTKNCNARQNQSPRRIPPPLPSSAEAEVDSEHERVSSPKPKITKPDETKPDVVIDDENEIKSVRGRRKLLYSKASSVKNNATKPIRSITSNLVKNVTSVIKSGSNLKHVAVTQSKPVVSKPAVTRSLKPPSGHQVKTTSSSIVQPKVKSNIPAPLQRQGTFTKDEEPQQNKSRIPTPQSNLPRPTSTSRIARAISHTNTTVGKTVSKVQQAITSARTTKSSSTIKSNGRIPTTLNRSSSADSRETQLKRQNLQNSTSNQSLKSDSGKSQNGAVKRSSTTNISQRSNSNSSITSNGSSSKKQVTSKIANLWKKVEQQKKLPPKKDSRVWIQKDQQPEESTTMIRSNTFDSKDGVSLLKQTQTKDFVIIGNDDSECVDYCETTQFQIETAELSF
ncbi:hypothetical protein RN001_006950 [Aquatica leii]|uniref:Adenomatous polyposis coli protein n=1 Tax=Aquatica leii TaxID=1421715 RepID=A0AAN7PJA1_9COLE|nr:hypothetical protein RN001_006950 [Aquatica leii]